VQYAAVWETPAHLCAGGVCAWSTCADWQAASCPLSCADVTILTEVTLQHGATETARTLDLGENGIMNLGPDAALTLTSSTVGCCASLGAEYVPDDANGECVVVGI
jgi:hypothetical protein